MPKPAFKIIDDEPEVTVQTGIVRLGKGRLRVTFDIPEFEMVTIRKDRQIKLEFDQYTTDGLSQHFMKGNRFYNDEAGAAGSVEKLASGTTYYDKDGKPYEPIEIPVPKVSTIRAAIRKVAKPVARPKP